MLSPVPSPFAVAGAALVARGYSALPIMPGDKAPGDFESGDWRLMRGWSAYCTSRPTDRYVDLWSKWPNAGVGVACGGGLVMVDIDLDDAVEAVVMALPATPVSKRGAKGLTLCFRGDTSKIKSRAFKSKDKIGLCDLLSDGKQSVMPPSIHPKTGLPYVYTTARTLLDTPLHELPELPDNVADIIGEALKPFGYEAEPERASFEWDGHILDSRSQSSDFFRRLNEDALANLDAWVPKLNLYRAVRNQSGWRAVPHWRASSSGTPTHKRKLNVSFDPKGIVDFGDGNKTYTPINVVLSALGCDFDEATRWLSERFGHDFSPPQTIVAGYNSPSKRAEREAAERASLGTAGAYPASTALAVIPDHDEEEDEETGLCFGTDLKIEDLASPPGLVGEIVDWIVSTAERPSRAVALGPALGFVGTLAGRLFASPTDLRTNLYIVTLAPSGYGKDRPREAIKRLALAAGLKQYLGAGRIMSTTALRNSLLRQPTCLFMLDEFQGTMRMITDKRNAYGQLLGNDLMEAFTSASTYFAGAEYAGTPAVDVYNPNLSIYGTSTQDAFWASIGSASALDGLLARMMLFNVEGPKPREVTPTATVSNVPLSLVAKCQAVAASHGNLANAHDGSRGAEARRVPLSRDAEAVLKDFKSAIAEGEATADWRAAPFLNRAVEHALKLALTVAVGCDPQRPEITGGIMEWAAILAWHATGSVMAEASNRIADSQREADYNRLLKLIRDAGEAGIPPSKVGDRIRNIDEKTRAGLLRDMQAAGRIRLASIKVTTRTRERWQFIR